MKKGFTLLELLIVIAIIAILAVVVFVALDPLSRFQNARNAQRWTNVQAMLDAAKLNQVDNGGTYETVIAGLTDDLYYTIGTCTGTGDADCGALTTEADCADLAGLVTSGHLPAIPFDPSTGDAVKTDYYIQKAATGVIKIGSCDPEASAVIAVSR